MSIEINEDAFICAYYAVEDEVIEMRDAGISLLGVPNGIICNHRDGTPSPLIRMRTRDAVRKAIEVYLEATQ